MEPMLESYDSSTSTSSTSDLRKSTMRWLDTSCTLGTLRRGEFSSDIRSLQKLITFSLTTQMFSILFVTWVWTVVYWLIPLLFRKKHWELLLNDVTMIDSIEDQKLKYGNWKIKSWMDLDFESSLGKNFQIFILIPEDTTIWPRIC
jgi:hypothetical protein